jgi:hypothetical protein
LVNQHDIAPADLYDVLIKSTVSLWLNTANTSPRTT